MALKTLLNKLIFPTNHRAKQNQKAESKLPRETSVVSWLRPRPEMVHGTICVREGKVIVTDPQNDGSYATILIPENPCIQIYVDGERVFGEVVVNEASSIEIRLSKEEPVVSYETFVSEDALSVFVRAIVIRGRNVYLDDVAPRRQLVLAIRERYTEPSPASPEAILNLLSKNGYNGTIDYHAVNRLCRVTGNQEEVVLRGVTPTCDRPQKLRASNSTKIEYDSQLHIHRSPVVSIGTPIAVLEPGMEGIVGRDVYGVAIPARNVDMQQVKLGYGIIQVNQDIVAIREGTPRFTKRTIDVISELVLEQDISIKDGAVSFDGNIVIHGSIQGGAVVKASGTVTVYGSIEQSSVFAGQGVFVQEGIHKSTVVSGHQQIHYESLLNLLGKMIPELKRFKEEYSLMVAHAIKRFDAHVTIPKIPSLLFEKRHERLDQMLGPFVDDYSEELSQFDHSYRELKDLVESSWRGDNRFKVLQKDIEILLDKLISLSDGIKNLPKDSAVVRATYISSSSIQSGGNIIVTGNCDSSTMESRRTVSVHKSIRGGFIVANKSIYVGELGNPSGVETSVRVNDSSGFIRIKLNHINTLLEVNGRRIRTFDTERDVRFGGN